MLVCSGKVSCPSTHTTNSYMLNSAQILKADLIFQYWNRVSDVQFHLKLGGEANDSLGPVSVNRRSRFRLVYSCCFRPFRFALNLSCMHMLSGKRPDPPIPGQPDRSEHQDRWSGSLQLGLLDGCNLPCSRHLYEGKCAQKGCGGSEGSTCQTDCFCCGDQRQALPHGEALLMAGGLRDDYTVYCLYV